MRPERRSLPLTHAVALGALHGPAELLPVSSSAHVALIPRLLHWPYADLPGDVRKTFEVALHAGSAPALALALRGELFRAPHLQALTFLPPAVVGLALERPIEQRLGGVRSVAVAQIAAGAALFAADLRPERRAEVDWLDHLVVGLAQATALVPGVSRSGAALTAARLRGLSRPAAAALSLRAALPVTVGAGLLKGVRAVREGVAPELRGPAAIGAAAACASALAALPLARGTRWRGLAAYRLALGAAALARASKST
jgi:undecaprenyl-diphosphatase